ncbi:MAG: hypothetical protein IPK97_11300 [Ahniella sp.]|nr:hypothetical protein [Ahniella sp.]
MMKIVQRLLFVPRVDQVRYRAQGFRACLLIALAVACLAAWAQDIPPSAGGNYVMRKQVVAGGGQRAIGGNFVLVGTVAQSDATTTRHGANPTHGWLSWTHGLAGGLFANG